MATGDGPDVNLIVLGAREEEVAIGVVNDLGERALVACNVRRRGCSNGVSDGGLDAVYCKVRALAARDCRRRTRQKDRTLEDKRSKTVSVRAARRRELGHGRPEG